LKSSDGDKFRELAKQQQSQGKPEYAIELLNEAISLYQQVYGPIHSEIGSCLSDLSLLYYQSEDIVQAISHQERALIIGERIHGLDSAEVARHYTNLSVLHYAQDNTPLALCFMARARYLHAVIFGTNHPETVTSESNIALMLQTLGHFKEAHERLLLVVAVEEQYFGPDNLVTAIGYHALAKSCGLLGEFKAGLTFERLVYDVYLQKYGADDPRTKESSLWMNQLAQNAVLLEKAKKESPQWSQRPDNKKALPPNSVLVLPPAASSSSAPKPPASSNTTGGSQGSKGKGKKK